MLFHLFSVVVAQLLTFLKDEQALRSGKADRYLNLKDLQLPQPQLLALHTLTRIS